MKYLRYFIYSKSIDLISYLIISFIRWNLNPLPIFTDFLPSMSELDRVGIIIGYMLYLALKVLIYLGYDMNKK